MSVPRGTQERGPPMPFFPNFLLRDLIGWFLALAVLITIIVLAPVAPRGALFPFDFLFEPQQLLELGSKADPFASAPAGIKPEWYFLFMYQALKFLPATIIGLEGEMVGVLCFGVGTLALFLVPFLDRRASDLPPSRLAHAIGAFYVLFGLAMCALGALAMLQRQSAWGVASAAAGALWILGAVALDRRRRERSEPSLLFPAFGLLTLGFVVGMTIVGRLS